MIHLSLRDTGDLALIRKALMQLPRIDPDTKTAAMELLLHLHDTIDPTFSDDKSTGTLFF